MVAVGAYTPSSLPERQTEGCTQMWPEWKRKQMPLVGWWAPKKGVTSVTWRWALRLDPALASVVWEQQKAKAHAVSAEKIGQQRTPPWGKMSYDTEENLQRAAGQLQRGESLRYRGQKRVVDGCSAVNGVVVGVQVEVGWERTERNFVVVIGVVFGDGGSLERDVSAANRRARVEDRDCCCLRFLR